MPHVPEPDAQPDPQLEMMAVGALIYMLFIRAQPTPGAIDAQAEYSVVSQEAVNVFEGLHLAVRWRDRGSRSISFDDIKIRPSTDTEGALRVHITSTGWGEVVLRQLQHGLEVMGCQDQSVSYGGGGVADSLIFTLPAAVVARLQG